MTTYKVNHDRSNPYVRLRLNKAFLESPDLSAKAKGLLAYLLSRPDNWRICLGQLVKVFADGEASIRSGLKELSDAGYLVKAQIRDRLGRIQGWRTDVFEIAAEDNGDVGKDRSSLDKNDKENLKRKQQQKDLEPKRPNPVLDYPDVAYPDVDFQHLDNRTLINNEYLLNNEFNNSPLTPQGAKKEKNSLDRSDSFPKTCTTQPNISTSLAEEKIDRENKSSAPVLTQSSTSTDRVNETSSLAVRKYDPALGINPSSMQKTLQQRSFQWLPDGPWSIDGKLDPQFLDWQATEWMKAYGGDLHKKKADVLRHFKKDPANVAIAWSNYSEQQIDRYKNAATRMEFGIEIKEDEQTQLLAHQRAITEPLPEEMNPVWRGDRSKVLSLAGVEEAADVGNDAEDRSSKSQSLASVNSRSIDNPEDQSCGSENIGSIATSPNVEAEFASHLPKNAAVNIPIDADGCAENPDAYKIWQPKKMEGEVMSAEEWQDRWARLKASLLMPK